MPLFDAYLIVDWSASSVPKRGPDSIWYCLLRRGRRGLRRQALANPPTRSASLTALRGLLARLAGRGHRTLVGFDFPNAYPRGFARRAGFSGPPWRAVWDGLDRLVRDDPDNRNNRFAVAAALNERISGGPFPFWGCPAAQAGDYLLATKTRAHADDPLPERRLCEGYLRSTQPCWKLYTTGSVGGQALLGIPIKRALRFDPVLASHSLVWPFETGLAAPDPDASWRILLAEVYPSIVPVRPGPGEVKDALQVEATARFFAMRDACGELGRDFAGPADLSPAARRLVAREEGWILGAGTVERPRIVRAARLYSRGADAAKSDPSWEQP